QVSTIDRDRRADEGSCMTVLPRGDDPPSPPAPPAGGRLGTRPLPYAITGLSTLIGRVLTIAEWAGAARIPLRGAVGTMSGELVERILGISGKSWDPELFADLPPVIAMTRDALASAQLEPSQIDAMIVVTCSPYEVMLDQDTFRLARELRLPDQVVPIQIGAGCA